MTERRTESHMRSLIKTCIFTIIGIVVFGACIEYFGGAIEVVIEMLLYLLCLGFLAAGFIFGALV